MGNVFIVGNLIWISINRNETYGSKTRQYMLCGRRGGLNTDAILSGDELVEKYPNGVFKSAINVSDTISFEDK